MNVQHHSTTEVEKPTHVTAAERNYFLWVRNIGILVVIVLGFFYLLCLNSLATRGFALEEFKTQRMEIQQETEAWDIALAIPTSLYALQSSEQIQEMESITSKRRYLYVQNGQVAMNNEQ
jgi:hypothetical protein